MKSALVYFCASILGCLPLSINRWFGRQLGRAIYFTRRRHCRTSFRNLTHCFPDMSEQERKRLVYRSSLHSGMVMTESFWIWKQPERAISSKIEAVYGKDLINDVLDQNRGVLLTGPHCGSWELITFWCGLHFNSAAMYRKAKIAALNNIIIKGREKTGAKMISGERKHARRILNHLKQGNVFILLTDQEPEKGSGIYVNFFGKPAYTMTLPKKLVEKTQAELLLFFIERTRRGFIVHIKQPDELDATLPLADYLQRMNQNIETIVLSNRPQFEWGYKRFKTPPDGDYDFYPE